MAQANPSILILLIIILTLAAACILGMDVP